MGAGAAHLGRNGQSGSYSKRFMKRSTIEAYVLVGMIRAGTKLVRDVSVPDIQNGEQNTSKNDFSLREDTLTFWKDYKALEVLKRFSW